MRDYQPTKNNPYQLEHELYRLMLCIIRSYPKFKKQMENHVYMPGRDLVLSGSGNSVRSVTDDPIERQAIILANISTKVVAVERALEIIPEEYRQPILDNIQKERPLHYCDYASTSTLSRHKSRFIYKLARELDYI